MSKNGQGQQIGSNFWISHKTLHWEYCIKMQSENISICCDNGLDTLLKVVK